jgi:hypothetical protein
MTTIERPDTIDGALFYAPLLLPAMFTWDIPPKNGVLRMDVGGPGGVPSGRVEPDRKTRPDTCREALACSVRLYLSKRMGDCIPGFNSY